MVSLEVTAKFGPDAICRVVDPGLILSRANLTFRRGGKTLRASNSMLPVVSSKVGGVWMVPLIDSWEAAQDRVTWGSHQRHSGCQ